MSPKKSGRDRYHARAVTIARRALESGSRFVGTVLILAEFQAHTLYLMSPALMRARSGAPVSVFGLGGVSPLQAYTLRPVINSNCVLARGGGKQLEMNGQSVG